MTLNGVGSKTASVSRQGDPAANPRPARTGRGPTERGAALQPCVGWPLGAPGRSRSQGPASLHRGSRSPSAALSKDAPGAAPAAAAGGLGSSGGGRRARDGAAPYHGGCHPGHRLRRYRLHVGRPDAGDARRLAHSGAQPEPWQPGHRQLRAGALP